MYKYITFLFLSIPPLSACEFIAGTTVPEAYDYVDQLLLTATHQHRGNEQILRQIDEIETQFLVLLAGRNDGNPTWKDDIEQLVTRINGLISQ
jgi:hypothetical protein